jgi:hypothetical protein
MADNPYAVLLVTLLVAIVVFMLFATGAVAKLAYRPVLPQGDALALYERYRAAADGSRYDLLHDLAVSRRPPVSFNVSLAGADCTPAYFLAVRELDAAVTIATPYRSSTGLAVSDLPRDARNRFFAALDHGVNFLDAWDECVSAR